MPAATRRPGYHPSVQLTPFIYGYRNRVALSRLCRVRARSSRSSDCWDGPGRLAHLDTSISSSCGPSLPISSLSLARFSLGVPSYSEVHPLAHHDRARPRFHAPKADAAALREPRNRNKPTRHCETEWPGIQPDPYMRRARRCLRDDLSTIGEPPLSIHWA